MSMTSREVAAILSTAGPMAPPSDDDDDDNYTIDDVSDHVIDDVSELEEEQQQRSRLSSSMQLLRVSSNSSTSPSDLSTPATSTGLEATPPCNKNTPPYDSARLNNGRSGRGAEQFRPQLDGVCDMSTNGKKNTGILLKNGS